MKVYKFGGSSLSNPEKIRQAVNIVTTDRADVQAVVFSAFAKVTNQLDVCIQAASSGLSFSHEYKKIKNFHFEISKALISDPVAYQQLIKTIENYWQTGGKYLQAVKHLKQCPADTYAWLISLGERLSVIIVHGYIELLGIKSQIIEADQLIISRPKDGYIDLDLLKHNLRPHREKPKMLWLMGGFMASDIEGKSSTLGRNGSDYSAALLAVGLGLSECVIWTDVDGIYNADPLMVKNAALIENLSYHEAMDLSWFGAGVLHPKTISPLMRHNIPCRIKNSSNPKLAGSFISGLGNKESRVVTAVSHLEDVVMLTVSGTEMKGLVGMAARVFDCMALAEINVILISQSSSEYSISFCIHKEDCKKAEQSLQLEFDLELKNQVIDSIEVKYDLSVITLISDNMKKKTGIAADFFHSLAIANVNITAIAQGSNERSISAVIESAKINRALNSCHQILFESIQQAEIILIGCGLVGDAFLQQISRQQNYLSEHNLRVKVCGIINSKGALLDASGIDVSEYKSRMSTSLESTDKEKLKLFRQETNMINPIIVDCTSSESVALAYLDFFKAGYHVVAANKKANTDTLAYYRALKHTSMQLKRQFHYETNVGAGLPVIETFRNLLKAGDKLITFEGILSGSMSYIFGLLDEGINISQAVTMAKHKGFTEPDPREDLSGMDVARKVLIIAREAGMDLELNDIRVESILNQEMMQCESIDDFMGLLETLDQPVADQVMQAQKNHKVLRYVGKISQQLCSVEIVAVSAENPLYAVKDGENALSFCSQYYQPIPLVLRGYGAGSEVTAAGIFSDVLKIIPAKSIV